MSMSSLITSKAYIKAVSRTFTWGIAIAIIGGLMLLNQYPLGRIILTLGGVMVAFHYFLASFTPPHVKPDWSLVFPELAGIYNRVDSENAKRVKDKKIKELTRELEKPKMETQQSKNRNA